MRSINEKDTRTVRTKKVGKYSRRSSLNHCTLNKAQQSQL